MSKHHHYHQTTASGGGNNHQNNSYHNVKYHNHHNNNNNNSGSHHELHHNNNNNADPLHNGLRNGITTNGTSPLEPDSNDTNNNSYNQKHVKRSSSSSGDAGSSKRTKLNSSQTSSVSVPSDKVNKYASGNTNSIDASSCNVPSGSALAIHCNIVEKLKELYRELRGDKLCKELHLSSSSFLLDKLVTRDRLNTLIINLYPGNKGYSLAFRSSAQQSQTTTYNNNNPHQSPPKECVHETTSWQYDNAHLLDALDAEELPPLLIDFCNAHCPHLYYNGAVIAQIRDYRQSYPILDVCDIHYVLLRPSSGALWDEINATVDPSWSAKERIALEAQLVLATAPPICLDPSPAVGIAAINATTERAPFASDGVVKMAKKFLRVTQNRNNKLEKKTHYPQTALASHVMGERRKVVGVGVIKEKRRGGCHGRGPALRRPQIVDGLSGDLKNLPLVPASQRYDWQPRNTERLTFETDRDNCQYRVRVELFERPTTCEVSGQLTLERQKGTNAASSSGRMCPFKLSSPLAARRYVKEFMGIFTEEGRKFVKITHERETRAGREIMEMQTGEKLQNAQTPKVQTITAQPQQQQQPLLATQPQLQVQQQQQQQQQPPSSAITSPPPPALVATTPSLKLAGNVQQRIIATRPTTGQQVVVLAQVKQESNCSAGDQVIKNLLNQPRAPMTQTMVNGLNTPEVQTVYLQVDNSNLIHMTGAGVSTNLQFQQLIATPVTQATPTYTMNVQTVTPQQVTVVKRHRDM